MSVKLRCPGVIIDISTACLSDHNDWFNKRGEFTLLNNANLLANQKSEYFVYSWLCAHEMFDITCFPAFVRALHVILSIMLIRKLF